MGKLHALGRTEFVSLGRHWHSRTFLLSVAPRESEELILSMTQSETLRKQIAQPVNYLSTGCIPEQGINRQATMDREGHFSVLVPDLAR
jgi:hypothetical protein